MSSILIGHPIFMRYRIKREGDAYYPQYKGWFFWKYYERAMMMEFNLRVWYRTLEEAQVYLDEQISKDVRNAIKETYEYSPPGDPSRVIPHTDIVDEEGSEDL
jgi:hypothetical protein